MKRLVICFNEIYSSSKDKNETIDCLSFSGLSSDELSPVIDIFEYIEQHKDVLRDYAVKFYSNVPANLVSQTDLLRYNYKNLRAAFPGSLFSCGENTMAGSCFEVVLKISAIAHLIDSRSYQSVDFVGFPASWSPALEAVIRKPENQSDLSFIDGKSDFFSSFFKPAVKCLMSLLKISVLGLFRTNIRDKKNILEKNDVIFIDYLFDLDERCQFRHWRELPEVLSRQREVSMLHIFVPTKTIPDLDHAKRQIVELNSLSTNIDHLLVDSRLDIIAHCSVMWKSLLCAWDALMVLHRSPAFVVSDFLRSFCSSYVFNYFLRLYQFNRVFQSSSLDKSTVVFVGENQAWERCAVSSAFERGCREFVFSLHTAYRYWDFRYALPIVCGYNSDLCSSIEAGDTRFFLACNGDFAARSLKFQKHVLVRVVESLRITGSYKIGEANVTASRDYAIAWIIGDFDFQDSKDLLSEVCATPALVENYIVRLRPHPADDGRLCEMFSQVEVDKETPIPYERQDLIVSLKKSSFTFEAILKNWRVIVFEPKTGLDLSPLNNTGIAYDGFAAAKELEEYAVFGVDSLTNADSFELVANPEYFFKPNSDYSRWINMIEESKCRQI